MPSKVAQGWLSPSAGNAAVRGEKTEIIHQAVSEFKTHFHITELQRRCTGVSLDMIRKVLKDMSDAGEVKCTGRGKTALRMVIGNGNR